MLGWFVSFEFSFTYQLSWWCLWLWRKYTVSLVLKMSSKFTCINCRVAFSVAEAQREHYKSDWHRYNLKRKVVELPPVTAEEFQRRVILQREHDESAKQDSIKYCSVCHKSFNSLKSFENHLKSKKHTSLSHGLPTEMVSFERLPSPQNEIKLGNNSYFEDNTNLPKSVPSEDVSEIEEVESDEWFEEFSDDNPILRNNCLFCNHHSATMLKNLKHMTVSHSFFIPDIEYIVDLRGLLCYLGEKISQGYLCLWCNDHGKSFHSSAAAQQHMIDRGHCKMLHEGETLLEYSDYYDYRSSYPDHDKNYSGLNDQEVSIPVIENDDYQLILPSGNIIGHRSLMRYFRQNIDPNRSVVPVQNKIHRVIAQYKALGWTETAKEAVAKKERDLRFMNQIQSKYKMKLGVKANNLSIKRPQVNF